MKTYVHSRLDREERAALEALKRATGKTESQLVRRGLQLVVAEQRQQVSALDLAGESAGRFRKGPRDLSSNPKHMSGFGE